MVTDQQVRKLMKLIQSEETLTIAAAKSGMDEKMARRYRQSGRLPSQCQPEHSWQTRPDPFSDCWPEIQELLQSNPGFEAKTIFADLYLAIIQRLSATARFPDIRFVWVPGRWRQERLHSLPKSIGDAHDGNLGMRTS